MFVYLAYLTIVLKLTWLSLVQIAIFFFFFRGFLVGPILLERALRAMCSFGSVSLVAKFG